MPASVRRIVRAYYAALAGGDDDALVEIVSPRLTVETSGRTLGVADFLGMLAVYRRAFPDLDRTIRSVTVDGARAAVVVENAGTHTGEFLTHPPTGRRFSATGIDVLTIARGRIAAVTGVFDTIGMLAQLGLYGGAPRRVRR